LLSVDATFEFKLGITTDSAEKATTQMIASLNSKVASTESKFNKLQDDVKRVCLSDDEHSKSTLTEIRQELAELKNKVLEDKEAFSAIINGFSEALSHKIIHVENLRRKEADEMLRNQSKSDFEKANDTLELERNKLEDCHREIEIYRQQLEHSTREVDRMKSDAIEEKETFENRLKKEVEQKCTEKEEAVKKLMLEHELELESVRQELETSEKVLGYQQQIASFKSRLHENEKYVDDLRKKTRILEMTQEEKFQTEKEKIVQILEAGFAQREKLAIQQAEEGLEVKHVKEVEDSLKEQQTKSLGELLVFLVVHNLLLKFEQFFLSQFGIFLPESSLKYAFSFLDHPHIFHFHANDF
jgi:hypothetical protein